MLEMVRHTCSSRVMKKAAERFVKYRMTEALTVRRDLDGPSQVMPTRTCFDRFSAIRVLILLGFCFFINSLKNLIFEVRLWEIRHHIIRLCVLVFDFGDSYK